MEYIKTFTGELTFCRKASFFLAITILLLSSVIVANHSAQAQQLVCPGHAIKQLTNDPEERSEQASINFDGKIVAFSSLADHTGGNPDNNREIFFVNSITGVITQITNTTGLQNNGFPSVNADGTLIAFRSNDDFNGGNPDGSLEIWLYNSTTGVISQITDSPFNMFISGSTDPSISADGTRIAFRSDDDFNGGNPDGRDEIWIANTATGIITQITDSTLYNSVSPSISAEGNCVAFTSTANINGGNPDHNSEIYLADVTNGTIQQITFTTGFGSGQPSVNADGTRIAFRSRENFTGGNPGLHHQTFVFDTNTNTFTQLTNGGFGVGSVDPSIDYTGTIVAIESELNLDNVNPENNRSIIVTDTNNGVLIPVTSTNNDDSEDPVVSGNGSYIAFESQSNINGGNPDGFEEIYLALCLDPMTARNIPTLSEWGLIAMAGVLGLVGFIAIRKKYATV